MKEPNEHGKCYISSPSFPSSSCRFVSFIDHMRQTDALTVREACWSSGEAGDLPCALIGKSRAVPFIRHVARGVSGPGGPATLSCVQLTALNIS